MIAIPHPKVLIVDDELSIGEILSRWLTADGYRCTTIDNATGAMELFDSGEFGLVVCDITMPGMSGIELLRWARSRHPDVAFVMVTAVDKRETAIEALRLGAYGYVMKPFDRNEILINVYNALERRRLMRKVKKQHDYLEGKVRTRTQEVHRREEEIVMRLVSASEYRDDETGQHICRIGRISAILAKAAGWKDEARHSIRLAGPMHDVGKVGVPDAILRKPGKLTEGEYEIIKTHTRIGAAILEGSDIPLLAMAKEVAKSHHEKWDGTGYPEGLSGETIPLSARVVAIADVYDALVSHRVYRPPLPDEEALRIMRAGQGTHFDPNLFDCFLGVLPEIREVRHAMNDTGMELNHTGAGLTPKPNLMDVLNASGLLKIGA